MRVFTPWEVKDRELKSAVLAKCKELIKSNELGPIQITYTHDGPNDSIIALPIYYVGEFTPEDWIRVLTLGDKK